MSRGVLEVKGGLLGGLLGSLRLVGGVLYLVVAVDKIERRLVVLADGAEPLVRVLLKLVQHSELAVHFYLR